MYQMYAYVHHSFLFEQSFFTQTVLITHFKKLPEPNLWRSLSNCSYLTVPF